jgi:hypothetical protein
MSLRKIGIGLCLTGGAYIAFFSLPHLLPLEESSRADLEPEAGGGFLYLVILFYQFAAGCVPILIGSVAWHCGIRGTCRGRFRSPERLTQAGLFILSLPFALFISYATIALDGKVFTVLRMGFVTLWHDLNR